jgi:membrane protein DedA with SNARE-associated domain
MGLAHLIEHFGLPLLFIGSGVEGEAVAATGGVLAHRGVLPLWKVALAVFGGSWFQGELLFLIGRGLGATRPVARLLAAPACVRLLEVLETRPASLILTFRFLFGLRTLTPLAIGASRVPVALFATLNLVGAAVWALVFVGAGYGLGAGIVSVWGRLPARDHFGIALGSVVVAVAALLAWRLQRRVRGAARRPQIQVRQGEV